MKININGYAQHGKDTVADLFVKYHGLIKLPISLVIASDIMNETNLGPYDSPEQCYEDRHSNRKEWYNFIRAKCDKNPNHYVDIALDQGDMFVGHRNQLEYYSSRPLMDATIWVDASSRGMPKENPDSCDMSAEVPHDFYIDNGNDMWRTRQQVDMIVSLLKNRKKAINAYT